MKTIGLIEGLRAFYGDEEEKDDGFAGVIMLNLYMIFLFGSALFASTDNDMFKDFDKATWVRISSFLMGYLLFCIFSIYVKVLLKKRLKPEYTFGKSIDNEDCAGSIGFIPIVLMGLLIINVVCILGQSVVWLYKNFFSIVLFLGMLFMGCLGLLLILMAFL